MIFAHQRMKRRVSLLAAGVLQGTERDETRDHVDACPRCREEFEQLQAVVASLESDPVRTATPDVPLSVLMDRVEGELDRGVPAPSRSAWGGRLALPAAAAAALALVLLGSELASRLPTGSTEPSPPPVAAVPPDVLARLERNMAREHAARYLSEAQDVLLAVSAATETDCIEVRDDDRVDVGEAPDRSRQLLARRALVVEGRPEAVASARAVLDDVELALREVADLPACVRRMDVSRLRQEMDRRQLHMRIRLMTRELEG